MSGQSVDDELLPVGEAAALIGISVDTLKRWERAERIRALRTPTNHRRYRRREVLALLDTTAEPTGDAR